MFEYMQLFRLVKSTINEEQGKLSVKIDKKNTKRGKLLTQNQ
jgi:hypothetical protein